MRWALLGLAACSSDPNAAFGFEGVVQDELVTGSAIGLWTSAQPTVHTFKFGDGQATPTAFGLGFRFDPPLDGALDTDGIGVAQIGMLPGVATVPDGDVDTTQLNLIGLSTDSAVIYKSPGATGPAWTDAFPDGYACGVCVRGTPDTFTPADCTFVTIERFFSDPCRWY